MRFCGTYLQWYHHLQGGAINHGQMLRDSVTACESWGRLDKYNLIYSGLNTGKCIGGKVSSGLVAL
jgi:hypothetical protein